MIKAVLFDMDGVLIEAKDWHYEALNRAVGIFGYKIDREAHLTTYDGLPTRTKLEMLAKAHALPRKLIPFINELKQTYTIEMVYSLCRPTFTHQYALSKLKAEGYKIAVCSNSVRKSIEVMMQLSALDKYIDLILSNEDVKRAKPDPEIYLTAMQRFDLRPEECLVVEDNQNGIMAGRASGAKVMCVGTVLDVNIERIRKELDR